jgi:non-specific serine/threonine protein kinase/serine/threonine-protein kinase
MAEAIDLPAPQRAAWLDAQCAGDDALRREVQLLLEADAAAEGFLDLSALAETGAARAVADAARGSPALAADRRVGAYRILRELGHGGMGVVYLASRADDAFEKHVAVKVVRGGSGSDVAERRFRDERRILATLDHPHIARLLDGGTTDDGLSYLVMEYVDGVPIDVHCETGALPLAPRLRLFQRVCAAVQYAHQRLVIHRDIKARNILVMEDGTPKLLDFGIAKLTGPDADTEAQTQTGLRAFTLENASPEQVRGEPMTVASDVYALGVLLYRLVTGDRPYAQGAANDAVLIRAICEEAPVRPSLAARGRGVVVDAELDWVILKALRKEPERRYESVERLADDVRRLLEGLPVHAAPDSRAYRARKFVSRHRWGVAASVLLAASLVGGIVATTWQARRADAQRALAEERLQSARRLANAMIFELNDALESGVTGARALLLQRATEQLDALSADAPEDPVLGEELATAYHRLGDLQGLGGSANIGDRVAGRASHGKGLAVSRALVARAPDDAEARARLVSSLMRAVSFEDEVEPSFRYANEAVSMADALSRARPKELRFTRLRAAAHYTLGTQYRAIRENARALESFERATPLYQEVFDVAPNAEVRRSLALCRKRLGAILVDFGQYQRALDHLRQAVELDTVSLSESPRNVARRRDLSTSNTQLGFALGHTEDLAGALAAYERALAIREELLAEDPTNTQARSDLAVALWYVGELESRGRRYNQAIATLQRAAALKEAATYTGDDMPARIATVLSDAYEGAERWSDALSTRRKALSLQRAYLAAQPQNKKLHAEVVRGAVRLSGTLIGLGRRQPTRRTALALEACRELEGVRDIPLGEEPDHVQLATSRREALAGCAPPAAD